MLDILLQYLLDPKTYIWIAIIVVLGLISTHIYAFFFYHGFTKSTWLGKVKGHTKEDFTGYKKGKRR